jgi:very-long-chain enoyl-CoA reductase
LHFEHPLTNQIIGYFSLLIGPKMKISVVSRSLKPICELDLVQNTVQELKLAYQKSKHTDIHRLYFSTVPSDTHPKGVPLKDGALPDGVTTVVFKDLGPQISWRLVYVIEYMGPLLAFPILFFLRTFIWGPGSDVPLSDLQKVAFGLFCLHFIKRELETMFLHKFSRPTMPLFNLFKNSGYYSFCGWYIAYFVMHPKYVSPSIERAYYCVPIFIVLMICNFVCHWILANLRPEGTSIRRIPKGFLFELVSCPNYLTEIIQWWVYAWMIQSVSGFVFAVVGGGQMAVWALDRHLLYKKEFNGENGKEKYPRRNVLIPYIW